MNLGWIQEHMCIMIQAKKKAIDYVANMTKAYNCVVYIRNEACKIRSGLGRERQI